MLVSDVNWPSITLSPVYGVLAAAGGAVSLFATYWDDAWHTDIGRDTAFIAPHLALYGSVAVVGLVVLGWGLVALARTRSIRAAVATGRGRTTIRASPPRPTSPCQSTYR